MLLFPRIIQIFQFKNFPFLKIIILLFYSSFHKFLYSNISISTISRTHITDFILRYLILPGTTSYDFTPSISRSLAKVKKSSRPRTTERIIITLSGRTKGARVVIGVPMCTSTQIAHYERSPYLDPSRALRNWG